MAYYGSWKIDDYLTFCVNTHNANTGNAQDANAVPTYQVNEDETGAPIATGNMALLDDTNTVGFYSERIQLLANTGFEKGKSYHVYVQANVAGVIGTLSHAFQIEAEVDANAVSDKTGFGLAANAVNTTSLANATITADKIAANAITAAGINDGAIDAATFAAGAINAAAIATNAIDANKVAAATLTAAKFGANAITAAIIDDGAIDAGALATNAITSAKIAANAITATQIAADAIAAAKIAANALDGKGNWNINKTGYSLAANAIDATIIADAAITAAKFAANAVSATALDIAAANKIANSVGLKTGATTSIAYDTLLERMYQMINNRMLANETDGAITLRNVGNTANVASGSVTSSSGTTARAELTWA